MRRAFLILLIIGSFVSGSLMTSDLAFAPPDEKQRKFKEIWNAIFGLQNQIDKLNDRVLSIENPPLPPPPSPITDVSIPEGSSVAGCEETNSCFQPAEAVVDVGGEVTWTNSDTAAHTVTSGDIKGEGPDGIFDSSLIAPAKTFSHKFEEAGTFKYFCMVHP